MFSYSLDHAQSWSNPIPLGNGSSDYFIDDIASSIAASQSTVIVVWAANVTIDYDIFYQVSSDGGRTWNAPSQFSPLGPTDLFHDRNPVISADEFGTWIVIWGSNNKLNLTADTDYDLLWMWSVDNAVTWTPPEFFNSNALTDANTTSSYSLDDGVQFAKDDTRSTPYSSPCPSLTFPLTPTLPLPFPEPFPLPFPWLLFDSLPPF